MPALLWIIVAALVLALAPASVLTARKVDSLVHARSYRRTLANIELLEISLGFREPTRGRELVEIGAMREAERFRNAGQQARYIDLETLARGG